MKGPRASGWPSEGRMRASQKPQARLSLRGGEWGVRTDTSGYGDALCFMAKTWARHKTTEV